MIYEKGFIYISFNDYNKEDKLYITQCGWQNHGICPTINGDIKTDFVVHIVADGEGEYEVKNNKFTVGKGVAFLLRPLEKIRYYSINNSAWTYFWIGFAGSEAENIISQVFYKDNHIIKLNDNKKLIKAIQDIIDIKLHNENRNYRVQSLFYDFIDNLLQQSKSYTGGLQSRNQKVQDFINYLKKNYSKDLSVSTISKDLGMERTTLYKLVNKEFGMSVQEYVLSFRLEIAETLLHSTSRTISEICYMSGFRNYSNFSKSFRKKLGVSPKKFRQRDNL